MLTLPKLTDGSDFLVDATWRPMELRRAYCPGPGTSAARRASRPAKRWLVPSLQVGELSHSLSDCLPRVPLAL